MSRPVRSGSSGDPRYQSDTTGLALASARSMRNDAQMAMAAARDYPVATSALVLTVGALGLLAGYLVGTARSTPDKKHHHIW